MRLRLSLILFLFVVFSLTGCAGASKNSRENVANPVDGLMGSEAYINWLIAAATQPDIKLPFEDVESKTYDDAVTSFRWRLTAVEQVVAIERLADASPQGPLFFVLARDAVTTVWYEVHDYEGLRSWTEWYTKNPGQIRPFWMESELGKRLKRSIDRVVSIQTEQAFVWWMDAGLIYSFTFTPEMRDSWRNITRHPEKGKLISILLDETNLVVGKE